MAIKYKKTCCWFLIINLAKLTVHYNKYEHIWDSQVYGIQVYSILYDFLLLTSLQVYSTLDSLQEIVATYKSLTNQQVITLS